MRTPNPLGTKFIMTIALMSAFVVFPNFIFAQCPDATIRIEIFTDNYPEETTWQLYDQSSGLVIASDDLSIGGAQNTLYSWDVCVSSSGCFDFTINDAFGDGICCNEGFGYYNVYFNGALVATGGAFFDTETVADIGGCSILACPESTVSLQIFSDNFPEETSWIIIDRNSGATVASDDLTGQPDQTLVTYDNICVSPNGCYDFYIFDDFGDGICCNFGNGFYNLYLDGILQATGGSFADADSASFGSCVPVGNCDACQGPPPANDACAGSINLGQLNAPADCLFGGLGTAQTFNGSNICATAEFPYGYIIGCQTGGDMSAPAADVWYSFQITGSDLVVNFTSGLRGVSLGLWQDAGTGCNGLVARNCAETTTGGNLTTTFVALGPGTYYLQISGIDTLDQCDFTFTLTNNQDCDACIQQNNLTASPSPVNGRYQAGTTVTFTYTIEDYNQTSVNWIHGIVPHFGPGWDLSTLTNQVPPASCDVNGSWSWYNQIITGTFRPISDGPGFFFESTLGCPLICDPSNPGDNYGDQGVSTACQLVFQWTITTVASCPPGQTGDDLSIEIFNYGDSETGSWNQAACENDPNYLFFATLFCCDSSEITVQSAGCFGSNSGSITVQGVGIAPYDYELLDQQGNFLQASTDDNDSHTFTSLSAGIYQVRTIDENLCQDLQQVEVLQGGALVVTGTTTDVSCNGASDGSIDVTVSGGAGGYTYSWGDGPVSEDRSGLPAGTYSITVFDANLCSGTESFLINEAAAILNTIVQAQICDGESYLAGGAFQTEPGTYFDTLLTSAGCDSVIETQLSVLSTFFSQFSATVCEGDGIFAGGAFQTEAGVYYDTLAASNGCDSIIETTLTVFPEFSSQVDAFICEGDSLFAGGAFQTESGTYVDSFLTANGCDSIITTTLTVGDIVSESQTVSICPDESFFAGGAFQTEAGTYYDTFATTSGCDSVLITELIILPTSSGSQQITICEGDSYFVGGADQTEAGFYVDTLTGANGCDSILTTELILTPPSQGNTVVSICEGDNYFVGGAFQTEAGFYVDTLFDAASNGCDSVLTTELILIPASTGSTQVSICEGDSYFVGGAFQTEAGFYIDTLVGSNGCDSILTTELILIPASTGSTQVSICEGDSYFVGGADQTEAGFYTDTLVGSNGCDSILTTELILIAPSVGNSQVSICQGDSVFAGGAFQTEKGFYTDTLFDAAASGCDSILITEVIVIPPSLGNTQVSICDGDSYFVGGADQTEAGFYTDTLFGGAASGCDSILTTELIVITPSAGSTQVSICEGDSYFVGGANQTEAGFYVDTLIGSNGCDSILTTELIVIPPSVGNTQVSICEGDSYFVGGANQTEAGFYTDTLFGAAANGCDSILITELLLLPPSFGSTIVSICDGDSYFVGGADQTEAGFYADTLVGSNGCDSILTTQLILLPNSSPIRNIDICNGDAFLAGGALQTISGTYYDTLVAANGCDSIVITNLNVGSPLQINFDVNELSCDCTTQGGGSGNETCTLDFAGLPHGTIIPGYFADLGVSVSANASGTFPDQLIVFNSNLTGTPDPDLQAGIGNIAIFPHNLNDNNNDGLVDSPDDQGSGGTITFTFDNPRTVYSFTFVDNDRNGGSVKAYDASNTLLTTVNVPSSTAGSVQDVTLNISGVTKLTITYVDSRGVGRISFSCPPQTCEQDLSGFAHGEIVTGQEIAPGIIVTGTSNSPAQFPNAVAIFNSNVSGSLDPDLEVGIGNLLMLPQYLTDNNGDGNIDNPSDAANGGKMTFTFDRDRTVYSIKLVDNDRNNGTIKAFDANNVQLLSVSTPSAGASSIQTYNLNISGVRRLEVNYWDSRGVTGLLLDCPLVNCCDGNATANASGGFPPYQFSWSTGSASAYSGDSLCEGTYSVTVTDALGCTASDDVSLVRANVTEQTVQICEGESILLGGALQTEPGFYYDTLGITDGCFDILKTELIVLPNSSATIQVQICQGQSYFAGGAFQTEAGTYIDVLVAANSCDSILTTELSVLPALTSEVDAQICEGQSYFAGGTDQTVSGTYTDIFTSSGGCDSIVTTNLTVLPAPVTSANAQICEGDSLFVGGSFQMEAGVYVDTFTSANGCDSIVETNLSVFAALIETLFAEICEGESYLAGGALQTEPGIYVDTLISSGGCDSIVVTNLAVNPVFAITQQIQICTGDSFFAGGAFQTESGTYVDVLESASGCDSTITTELSVLQTIIENRQASICEGDSIFAGGAFQTEPGTYVDSFVSAGGCDSVLITELSFTSPSVTNVSVSICAGDSIFAGGAFQTEPGTYVDSFVSAGGCDSLLITELSFTSPSVTNVSVSLCAGDSLFVGGAFQTQAGTYTDSFTTSGGCDSIVITELTVSTLDLDGTVINVSCFGGSDGVIDLMVQTGVPPFTFQWSNNTSKEDITGLTEGAYSVTVADANGCRDSIGFNVFEPAPLALGATTTPVNCNGGNDGAIDLLVLGGVSPYTYLWETGDTTEDISGLTAGFYTVIVTDSNNCQATVIVQVLEPDTIPDTNVQISICEGEAYFAGGAFQTESGTYFDTLANTFGCDSVVVTELTMNPASGSSQSVTICENQSYFAGGAFQTESGTYFDTLTAANGCDSIVVTELTVNPTPVFTEQVAICEGDSLFAGGAYQTESGTYFDTILVAGCMQVDVTELTVNPNKLTGIEQVICAGDSVLAGGAFQTEAGTYFDTLSTEAGCDSIIATDVIVLPSSVENNALTICEGESVFAGGDFQTQSGIYVDTFTNEFGCDSIVITELTVVPSVVSFASAQICSGDSFFVGGGYQTVPGEYVDTLTSEVGCDSIVITDLAVLTELLTNIDVTICAGESYFAGGAEQTESGTYYDTLASTAGCDSIIITQLTVNAVSLSAEIFTVSCFGASDGIIDLTVSGGVEPYSFNWSNNTSDEDAAGLSAGIYSVTVEDINGCSASEGFVVTEPGPLALGGVPTPVSCNGESDGAIDLFVQGGTPPYSYDWDTGDTTEDISGLSAGFYTVQVIDVNGCQANVIVQVLEPDALDLSADITDESAAGASDGAIDLTVTGGTSPYLYSWSTGSIDEDPSDLTAGTYSVTVVDDNGCTAVGDFDVETLQLLEKPGFEVLIYPNPFDENLFIDIESKDADSGYIIMTDLLSKVLINEQIDIEKGENRYQLQIDGRFASSAYLIEIVTSETNHRVVKTVIKE